MLYLTRRAVYAALSIVDLLLSPITFISAFWLKFIRRIGVHRFKIAKRIFFRVGVFPIQDHYYEPLFNTSRLTKSLRDDRPLPSVDFNVPEQLKILSRFHYNDELKQFPLDKDRDFEFYYHNDMFLSGDAEFLYNIIRLFRPFRVIEIGGGYSTMMAASAIKKNKEEDPGYDCEQTCIEPYEQDWIEGLGITTIRERVEEVSKDLFQSLDANDILFIDSSHIIRPQGDVLFEVLEILPTLKSGVLAHFHDIFTPRDYLSEWVTNHVHFWNEQYLLEAFLSFNHQFRVIGALNFLRHHHPEELCDKCPILRKEISSREPGSFWIIRD